MANKISIRFFSLLIIVFLISSITSLGDKVINTNNSTASIISVIADFLGIGDDISDCTEGDINYQCPENITLGCYCNGGIVGSDGKIWQAVNESPLLVYSEAESYCSGLGEGWRIPSPNELFSVYNYDIKNIYSYNQPVKASWFIPGSQVFWTNYEYQLKHTFMLAKYGVINTIADNSYPFPTTCVKNLNDGSIFAFGENLSNAGGEDLSSLINGKYSKNGDYYEKDGVIIYDDNSTWRLKAGESNWLRKTDSGVYIVNGMMWQQSQSSTTLKWDEANNYCNNLVLNEFGDWRLPSRIEIENVCPDSAFDVCANSYWADSGQEDYYMPHYYTWNSNAGGYAPATARCVRENKTLPFGEYYPENSTQTGIIFVTKTESNVSATSSASSTSTPVSMVENSVGKESKIVELILENVVYNVNIDDTNKKIVIGLQDNTDISKLKIYVFVSDGAKVFSNGNLLNVVEGNKYLLNGLVSSLNVVSEDGSSKSTYNIVTAYPPTVSLDVLNSTIYEKQTTKVTWTPIGAKSCIASGNDTGWTSGSAPSAVDGSHTWTTGQLGIDALNTSKTYTYGIRCSNSAGDTNIVIKLLKVLPDLYTTSRGGSRMSVVAQEAGISGLNEFALIKTDIRKTFENPKAHTINCPVGTNYSQCVEDNNDDNGNYVLIGIK